LPSQNKLQINARKLCGAQTADSTGATPFPPYFYTVNRKTRHMFLSNLPQISLDSDKSWYTLFWINLRYSSLLVFGFGFPAHLNNVVTLPCET